MPTRTALPEPAAPAQLPFRVSIEQAEYEEGVRCVVMPCCGFTFSAEHTDEPDGKTYSCSDCVQRAEPESAEPESAEPGPPHGPASPEENIVVLGTYTAIGTTTITAGEALTLGSLTLLGPDVGAIDRAVELITKAALRNPGVLSSLAELGVAVRWPSARPGSESP